MPKIVNRFCCNCHYSQIKHEQVSFNEVMLDVFACPCNDSGSVFESAVTFVPMTNLEYLEWLNEEKESCESLR